MDDMVRRLLALDDLAGAFGGSLNPALREVLLARPDDRPDDRVVPLIPARREPSGGPAQVLPFRPRHHSMPNRTAS